MQLVETVITVVTLLSLGFFVVYITGLMRMPSKHRPKTPVFDRYGRPLPPRQNPGYKETEDERQSG